MKTESDILPYNTLDPTRVRTLVISPHPDDDSIGLGGTLVRHARAGDPVKIVYLTDGSRGAAPEGTSSRKLTELRQRETRKAAEILGVEDLEFLDIPDRELEKHPEAVERLESIIREYKPERIYLPSQYEFHPDHRAASDFAWKALEKSGISAEMWFYEIGNPLQPNVLVDISEVVETKRKAILAHETQVAAIPLHEHIIGLNRFRGYTLPPGVTHAEAFFRVPAGYARGNYDVLISDIRRRFMYDEIADVSIVVRTRNRPVLLEQALSSVVAQSYPPTQVIVVNDGGSDVTEITEKFSTALNIELVNHPAHKGRAAAANTGLSHAKCRFVGFLDDDDLLLPNHIETLTAILEDSPLAAAYTAVEAVEYEVADGEPGKEISRKLKSDGFDSSRILFENWIPFMSLLFRREEAMAAGGFDESLEVYEDWEFIIRLSRRGRILHVPVVTAEYRFAPSAGIGRTLEKVNTEIHDTVIEKSLKLASDTDYLAMLCRCIADKRPVPAPLEKHYRETPREIDAETFLAMARRDAGIITALKSELAGEIENREATARELHEFVEYVQNQHDKRPLLSKAIETLANEGFGTLIKKVLRTVRKQGPPDNIKSGTIDSCNVDKPGSSLNATTVTKPDDNSILLLTSAEASEGKIETYKKYFDELPLDSIPVVSPEWMVIELTARCNLKCKMCIWRDNIFNHNNMSVDLSDEILERLSGPMSAVKYITIAGGRGEPLMHPKFGGYFRRIREINPDAVIHLESNGLLLDRKTRELLINNRLTNIMLGMDAATPETYGRIRKGGDFDKLVSNAESLVQERNDNNSTYPRVGINFVVQMDNFREMSRIVELAAESGVDGVNFANLNFSLWAPTAAETRQLLEKLDLCDISPGGMEGYWNLLVSHMEILDDYRNARKIAEQHGIVLSGLTYQILKLIDGAKTDFEPVYVSELFKKALPRFFCMEPWFNCFVSAEGDVFPCRYFPRQIGNLRDESFDAIWKGERQRKFREMFAGKISNPLCISCYTARLAGLPGWC
ncbi:MAG: PIG-L family deacetylase [Planctomycetota bacterium]|jgi:radical SAM protein with 4Fe4S-binding SPASM domain